MNTKIILSLVVIVAVSAVAVGGTIAYFSDTETSTGNTFTAGTIDIAVTGENPWTAGEEYTFSGLEPGDSKDINVTLKNVGTNPVVVWKKVSVTGTDTGTKSEPECFAEGGTWDGVEKVCTNNIEVNNIDTQFVYSMKIAGNTNINKDWDVKVSDVDALWIPIGKLDSGAEVAVAQNYYFDETAGNVYQGDQMTIAIEFYAEQLDVTGPSYMAGSNGVVLENKNSTSDWTPVVGDGVWGILTWDDADNYTVKAWGLTGTSYKVAHYDGATTLMGDTLTPASGTVSDTDVFTKTGTGSKYWLKDLSGDNAKTLWEANLVNN